MKLSRLDDLPESLSMDKAGNLMIEKIMHLTLDILYLLTGEDYIVLKMSGGRITHSSSPMVCGGFGRTQSPVVELPPHSLTQERKNDKKILELTNKIIQLLTGEEWEYIKGDKDPHKNVMKENHQYFTPPDECNNEKPPDKCPSSSQRITEDHSIPQNNHSEIHNMTPLSNPEEVKVEETYEMGEQQCVEKDLPTHVAPDGSSKRPERCPSHPSTAQHSTEEGHRLTQDNRCEDLADLTIEVESSGDEDESEDEMSDWDEQDCMEDDIHTDRITRWSAKRSEIVPVIAEVVEPCKKSPQQSVAMEEEVHRGTKIGWSEKKSDIVPVIVEIDEPCEKGTQHSVVKVEAEEAGDAGSKIDGNKGKPPLTSVIKQEEKRDMSLPQSSEWEIHEDGSTHPFIPGGQTDHKRIYVLASRKPDSKNTQGPANTFSCPVCGKCFTTASHLEAHRKVHSSEAPFYCSECGKSFSSSSSLGLHLKVHKGEKLFACSECGKCFTVKANLLAHKAVHSGEKPFACAECGRRFALKSSLDTHLPVHALEKPFVCPACGKCFTTGARLALHQNTHTGEKSYECENCGKVFTTSGSLNRHKRTHTGEKPYACMVCGKCFNRETNLYRHQMIHTR
ncbi:oocyte zinc finger protein XlCOF7.1-like isoform X2 [Pseudophryne corroboree]|uniref:oocyte zinc finger protein XlCOF7.1-like isoform X2 n=1 Tax=Pseudophryne corroboree TaxID=495146 RepID=UPI0030819D90